MSRQIRRVALGIVVLFGALFLNLNLIHILQADVVQIARSDAEQISQIFREEGLRQDPRNARGLIQEYEIARGSIVVGERATGKAIARSQDTGGRLRYEREYPEGPRYAHLTGYHSFVYGRSGLERSFNDFLVGSAPEVFARNLADLLAGRQRVGDTLELTIDPAVQEAAEDALDGRTGAVVAIAPQTGAVLALYSSPSYDPNPLAAHDGETVRAAWQELQDDEGRPHLNRATSETYAPGSTFKLVTAAAALEAGEGPDTEYPDPRELELPLTTSTISNFGGGVCANGDEITMAVAMEVSCNTTFGQIGLDLGAERLVAQAERFGINRAPDLQLPNVARSRLPGDDLDEPATAQSAIGQRDVAITPLQMAMVSATIANGGQLMTPQVVRHIEDTTGRIIRQYAPEPWRIAGSSRATSAETATALRAMMVSVVETGTGTGAQIDGVEVAGKTGTAQAVEGRPPTVWFTGFAPADRPQVAVAVVVTDAGEDATGGGVAAPIARQVMAASLGDD